MFDHHFIIQSLLTRPIIWIVGKEITRKHPDYDAQDDDGFFGRYDSSTNSRRAHFGHVGWCLATKGVSVRQGRVNGSVIA